MQAWEGNAADFNWIARAGDLLGHDLSFLRTDAEDKVPFGKLLLSTSGLDWEVPAHRAGLRPRPDQGGSRPRRLRLAVPGSRLRAGVRRAAAGRGGGRRVRGRRGGQVQRDARRGAQGHLPGRQGVVHPARPQHRPAPATENSFDGILFNGAFHFIQDKTATLAEMYRVLRPGGGLVLAHAFCRSGLEDESTWEFYFALLKAEIYPVEFEDLRTMLTDAGFVEYDQYHRGSFAYIHVRKPIGETQVARQPLSIA